MNWRCVGWSASGSEVCVLTTRVCALWACFTRVVLRLSRRKKRGLGFRREAAVVLGGQVIPVEEGAVGEVGLSLPLCRCGSPSSHVTLVCTRIPILVARLAPHIRPHPSRVCRIRPDPARDQLDAYGTTACFLLAPAADAGVFLALNTCQGTRVPDRKEGDEGDRGDRAGGLARRRRRQCYTGAELSL